MPLDAVTLRGALGQFATGITVVTACTSTGEKVGVTMNSFGSLSLEPPLILFSIGRRAYSLPSFRSARGIAINVLSQGQSELSNRFAKALTDKWRGVFHVAGHGGAPLLAGALAHFQCAPYAEYDGGDHVIFVCRVIDFNIDPEKNPLIFFRGRFASLSLNGQAAAWPLPMHY